MRACCLAASRHRLGPARSRCGCWPAAHRWICCSHMGKFGTGSYSTTRFRYYAITKPPILLTKAVISQPPASSTNLVGSVDLKCNQAIKNQLSSTLLWGLEILDSQHQVKGG